MQVPKKYKGKQSASHARSPQQEAALAKRTGGRVTPGSGCGNQKGDVRVKRVLRLEAKTTKHKSFSVTRELVERLESTAMAHGELPAIVVEFNNDGKPACEVAVVPTWVLDAITGAGDSPNATET